MLTLPVCVPDPIVDVRMLSSVWSAVTVTLLVVSTAPARKVPPLFGHAALVPKVAASVVPGTDGVVPGAAPTRSVAVLVPVAGTVSMQYWRFENVIAAGDC